MFQHIVKLTRYRGEDTPHLLDLVFTDDENMVENRLTYLPELGNSDRVCIAYDLVLPTSHVIDSEDSTKYMQYVYGADFDDKYEVTP